MKDVESLSFVSGVRRQLQLTFSTRAVMDRQGRHAYTELCDWLFHGLMEPSWQAMKQLEAALVIT